MNPMLIGLLAGLGKSVLIDAPQQRKQALLAAKTAELSPWTKLQAQPVAPVDFLGPAMQGAFTGAAMEQMGAEAAAKNAEAAKLTAAREAQTKLDRDAQAAIQGRIGDFQSPQAYGQNSTPANSPWLNPMVENKFSRQLMLPQAPWNRMY